MRKDQLVLKEHQLAEIFVDKARENYLIKYTEKNIDELVILKEKIRKTKTSERKCVEYSGLDPTTYYKAKKLAERALGYFQQYDIDYKKTVFLKLINEFKVIKKLLIDRDEKLDGLILDQAEDRMENGEIVRRGDWKAADAISKKMNEVNNKDEEADDKETATKPVINIQVNGNINIADAIKQSAEVMHEKFWGEIE